MKLKFWKQREPLPGPGDEGWERALVSRVVLEHLEEQKRSRRWGVFFKLLTFIYLIALLVLLWPDHLMDQVALHEAHTALVDVKGIIAPETDASADRV